jgi:hypothetical protein
MGGAPQGCLVGDFVRTIPCDVAGLAGELALDVDGDVVLVFIGSMVGRVVFVNWTAIVGLLFASSRKRSFVVGFGEPFPNGMRVRRRPVPYGVSLS